MKSICSRVVSSVMNILFRLAVYCVAETVETSTKNMHKHIHTLDESGTNICAFSSQSGTQGFSFESVVIALVAFLRVDLKRVDLISLDEQYAGVEAQCHLHSESNRFELSLTNKELKTPSNNILFVLRRVFFSFSLSLSSPCFRITNKTFLHCSKNKCCVRFVYYSVFFFPEHFHC